MEGGGTKPPIGSPSSKGPSIGGLFGGVTSVIYADARPTAPRRRFDLEARTTDRRRGDFADFHQRFSLVPRRCAGKYPPAAREIRADSWALGQVAQRQRLIAGNAVGRIHQDPARPIADRKQRRLHARPLGGKHDEVLLRGLFRRSGGSARTQSIDGPQFAWCPQLSRSTPQYSPLTPTGLERCATRDVRRLPRRPSTRPCRAVDDRPFVGRRRQLDTERMHLTMPLVGTRPTCRSGAERPVLIEIRCRDWFGWDHSISIDCY